MKVEQLLDQKGLKKTKARLALAHFFAYTKHAQSYGDLQEAIDAKVDKSTLYRNLTAFEKAGIIHRVDDHSGIAKYAFGSFPSPGSRHAHFVCECCEAVYCLKEFEEPAFQLPEGFRAKERQTIVKGVCADCYN